MEEIIQLCKEAEAFGDLLSKAKEYNEEIAGMKEADRAAHCAAKAVARKATEEWKNLDEKKSLEAWDLKHDLEWKKERAWAEADRLGVFPKYAKPIDMSLLEVTLSDVASFRELKVAPRSMEANLSFLREDLERLRAMAKVLGIHPPSSVESVDTPHDGSKA